MNIFFDNVNLSSSSGPNGFAKKLIESLKNDHKTEVDYQFDQSKKYDVQLAFILANFKAAPIIQRLDGIYFNTDQDYQNLNAPIYATYKAADSVIFQSDFNKRLSESYFGHHDDPHVIHNGTDFQKISAIKPLESPALDRFDNVWSCASSWRPHKRLEANVSYFLEHADTNDCLVIAGENPDYRCDDPRVLYAGHLNWETMIGLFKRSTTFIHLSWLDHCPNVVVDANVAGCKIVCSSSGGTREIAGKNATIINEEEWDFSPIKLYHPPKLDFTKNCVNDLDCNLTITAVSRKYLDIFKQYNNLD